MEEIWKDIPEWEGYYQASNLGRIKSLAREIRSGLSSKRFIMDTILKPAKNNSGYYIISLQRFGVHKTVTVHRLIAKTFLQNEHIKPFINHKDGIKTNNEISNLEYVTKSENEKHAFSIGLKKSNLIGIYDIDRHRTFKKYVLQFAMDGSLINRFRGLGEASSLTGYSKSRIYSAISGKTKTSHGYIWKYENDLKQAI